MDSIMNGNFQGAGKNIDEKKIARYFKEILEKGTTFVAKGVFLTQPEPELKFYELLRDS